MSNVLLESASSGRVLITTDNPGCKETVMHGKTGYVYHGGEVSELVSSIKMFLNMDNENREKMGIAGREYVEAHFSREIVKEAYLYKIRGIINA